VRDSPTRMVVHERAMRRVQRSRDGPAQPLSMLRSTEALVIWNPESPHLWERALAERDRRRSASLKAAATKRAKAPKPQPELRCTGHRPRGRRQTCERVALALNASGDPRRAFCAMRERSVALDDARAPQAVQGVASALGAEDRGDVLGRQHAAIDGLDEAQVRETPARRASDRPNGARSVHATQRNANGNALQADTGVFR